MKIGGQVMFYLKMILAIAAAILGLIAIGAVVYTVWFMFQHRKQAESERTQPFPAALLKWTAIDYVILMLVLVSLLILVVDAVAIFRDRADFPTYHYGYLLTGVVLAFMGMLIMFLRLFMLHHALGSFRLPAPDDQRKPHHGNHPE